VLPGAITREHDPPAINSQRSSWVSITSPENSKDEHERMLACAEEVLGNSTCIPRDDLVRGDMGFSAQEDL